MWSEFSKLCEQKGIAFEKGLSEVLQEHLKAVKFQRDVFAEDPVYLDYIRGLPCLECQRPPRSEAHHITTGGMGTKTDDYRTVPLCRKHHAVFHESYGDLRLELKEWYLREATNYLIDYIKLVFGGK